MYGGILVTKICPNCKTKNQDSSEFCQSCGNKLQETLKTNKSKKSTKTVFYGMVEQTES